MPMITVKVVADQLEHKLDLAIQNAGDLTGPLRKVGNHIRRKALLKYKAQDFTGLAESTLKHRAAKGLNTLERKLHADVKKAFSRERGTPAPRGLLQSALAALGAAQGGSILAAGQSKGVTNRLAVLAEFERRHKGGSDRSDRALSEKQGVSLDKRQERAVAKAVSRPILGKLTGTLEVEVSSGQVTVASRTRQTHWTEVHNAGGAAGHGAVEPKRETLKVEADDVNLLKELLKEHIVEPFEK